MLFGLVWDASLAYQSALAELLGKPEDDALRTTDKTEPVDVFVLRDFPHQLGAMCAQTLDDLVDVLHREHDAPDAQRIRGCVLGFNSDCRRRVELAQLNSTMTVRRPQRGDLAANVFESNDTLDQTSFEWHLTLQLHTKLEKERLRSLHVLDYDEHVVHPFKCHIPRSRSSIEIVSISFSTAFKPLSRTLRWAECRARSSCWSNLDRDSFSESRRSLSTRSSGEVSTLEACCRRDSSSSI